MNKRILNIASYRYLPVNSGGQKYIHYFLEYLGSITDLYAVGTKDNDASKIENYIYLPLLKKSRLRYIDILIIGQIRKIIKDKKIETIIITQPYIGWVGVILKYLTGVNLVIHTLNIENERFRSLGKWWWWLLKIYETWILKKADKIFCISDDDKLWMSNKMDIDEGKCIIIPYGITQNEYPKDKKISKEEVCVKHLLNPEYKLLFFNGLLNYSPNSNALRDILNKINPLLLKTGLKYNILIAGKNLPAEFEDLKKWNNQHVFYAGFVNDIDQYTKAADVLLNPVNTGGGVKTKMIEALGLGATVIATENGAIGVDKSVCGEKLKVVGNDDWEGFVQQVIIATNEEKITPSEFYKKYTWSEIVITAAERI